MSHNLSAEFDRIAWLINGARSQENDPQFILEVRKEWSRSQPFLLSMIRGYELDLTSQQYQRVLRWFMIISEYFKTDQRVPTKPITQQLFKNLHTENIQAVQQIGELEEAKRLYQIASDIDNIRAKGLLAVVFKDVENYPPLQKLSLQNKFALLIGMKTLIQCFESLQY